MDLLLNFVDHLIPLLITLAVFVVVVAVAVGAPYCNYVAFVSQADTVEGKEKLAKYLAHKTGGRKINVSESWRAFLPAARDLHNAHVEKRKHHSL